MVTLNFKLISVLIFYVIQFSVENVKGDATKYNATRRKGFDFRDLVKENSGYSPILDQCPLRIYGGRSARISDIPYQVIIRRGNKRGTTWNLLCGGSIITRLYVATAAHCFGKSTLRILRFFRVVAGAEKSNLYNYSKKLQEFMGSVEIWRKIVYCYKHASYNPRFITHDFAVIQLDRPVSYGKYIQPIPMLRNSLGIQLEENALCLVSGYGQMENHKASPNLRMVCVPLVTSEKCSRYYGRGTIKSFQVCAGDWGRDSCQGDSGGPLTYHGYLIGVVSYGGRCGEAPGVYSLVSSYTTGDKVPFIRSCSVRISFNIFGIIVVLGLIFI